MRRSSAGIGSTLRWLPVCCWGLFVSWLLVRSPTPGLPWLPPGTDKAAHLTLYCVFAYLFCYATPRWKPLLVVMLCAVHGASMEILQSQVPGRSAEGLDLVADGLGASLGVWLARRKS